MFDFIVDYKDADGRYLHSSFKVPAADSLGQATRAIAARLAAGGHKIILATYVPGDRPLTELDAITDEEKHRAGLRFRFFVFDQAEILAAGKEVS